MKRAVFLDRDGVINKKLPDNYVKKWDEFKFLPNAKEAVKKLNKMGYLVIIVTNQRGIALGLKTEDDVSFIHKNMCDEFEKAGAKIDGIFYCPHNIEDNCNCRKPKPGMLLEAQAKFDIDFSKSFLIGDELKDMDAAKSVGIKRVYVGETSNVGADYYAKDILDAVSIIEKENILC